jgi:hypothetical protein
MLCSLTDSRSATFWAVVIPFKFVSLDIAVVFVYYIHRSGVPAAKIRSVDDPTERLGSLRLP